MDRMTRTPEELLEAAKHVTYEIKMLVFAADHLGHGHSCPPTKPSGNEKHMALESFLLHFRNLRAFLCPSLQCVYREDILAGDFYESPRREDVVAPERLARDVERLNGMLAHLSYERRSYTAAGPYNWKTTEMAAAAVEELRAFLATLPPDRAAWFPGASWLDDAAGRFKAMAPIWDA